MPGLRLTLLGTFALIALLTAAFAYIGFGARGDGGGESTTTSPPVAASALAPAVIDLEPASSIQTTAEAPPAAAPIEPAPSMIQAQTTAAALGEPPPSAIQTQAQAAAPADAPEEPPPAASAQSASADADIPAVEIVKTVAPSVARVTTELVGIAAFGGAPLPPRGAGTGIVLDEDGHILTNSHVIEGAETISATLNDGETYDASVVGLDPATDLAVIKISADGLAPAALGESANLLAGEDVIAIGYVMGLPGAPSVSKGVVSAVGRHVNTAGNFTLVDLIQTDAAINSGNSGGPLVNSRAEVVGVNTAIVRGVQGVGFAINIDGAKEVSAQLIANGFVRRGYVGVLPVTLNPLSAAQLSLDEDMEGVLLRRVLPNTPAADAGLLQGDIILAMDDNALPNTGELSKFLMTRAPGEVVETDILRDGEEMALEITLGTRPDN